MSVKDWAGKDRVWGELAAIREVQLQPRGPKGPQLTAIVFDATGSRIAKSWNLAQAQIDRIVSTAMQAPPVLRVSGTIEASGNYAGELTLDGVTPADPDEYDEVIFLAPLPDDHSTLVDRLDNLIVRVRDRHLAALLENTIGLNGKWRSTFLVAAAAKKIHHAYRGGLLRHSLEVAELAVQTAYHFRELHRDLLVTAALLHDCGKLFEMEHGWLQGGFTQAGNLLGHVYLGAERISGLCKGLKFPEDLRQALVHTLLSHHDELDYGSPVRPMLPEAIAIAKCDQISAELEAFYRMQRDALPGQQTAWRGERALFVGPLNIEEALPAPLPLPADPEERLLYRLAATEAATPLFGIAILPILGIVAAGDGIRSSDEDADPETREVLLPQEGADFLLRVTGDSMVGAGIHEGDLLLIRRQETARVGQVVVAHVPGSGPVVKRLTATPAGRYLTSENPNYGPIPINEEVRLQGVVVRLEREM